VFDVLELFGFRGGACSAAREFWNVVDLNRLFWSARRVGAGVHLTDCVNVNAIARAKLGISYGVVKQNQIIDMENWIRYDHDCQK